MMKLEKLNPSVKAATVLICVILLSFQYIIALNVTVFVVSLLLLLFFSDAKPKRLFAILIPAFVAAFGLFMMGLYYSRGGSITDVEMKSLDSVPFAVRAAASRNLTTALQLSTRLLSYAGFGILFALTTDGEYFVTSLMHQCHLSPKFAFGILAAFHLMPGMEREYKNVQTAFRTRGIHVGAFSMKVIFAMLVNCIRWSESVAMAMESKGFSGSRNRTYYDIPRIHWYDLACSAACIAGIVTFMILA
ncbi:MAG: energy-coupling factor transporter transmembrane protein EcfT [Clostridia bacterium]|nr:energy-coupling factor transporter transmembrane protein EcfT [Clostridia bacterium]